MVVWCDKIVGMIGFFEKECYKFKIVELKRMYVFFEYRGKGVVMKLFERVVYYVRIYYYDRIFLDMISVYKDVYWFYKKYGF